jgi:hypothetical protein
MCKATSDGDVGEVEGANGGLVVDRGGKLQHVHVAKQKTSRDTTLSCAWKESSCDPCGSVQLGILRSKI